MQQHLTMRQQKEQDMKLNETNQCNTRIGITAHHKYKYKQRTKQSFTSLIEKSLSDVYNNT